MGNFNFKDTVEQEATTQDLDYDYELSENVVDDLVRYSRSCMVKNEQQFVLTTLGYVSGFFESPKHFNSGVLIGTAGSGKSHLQNKVEKIFPEDYLYQATSGSEKSIIYDDSWEDCYIASLDELQKPGEKIIEILKSLHGGEDEEFRYQVTGDGRGADRDVDEIVRSAKPYWFLYAQMEPDFEMWDRLIKVPVHESKEKNEAVLATQWDHQFIAFGDDDAEYMYDFDDGRKALQDHMREIPKDATVKIPAGEEEFGGMDFKKHAKHIFDIARSETNRVSGMIASLVRASALLNYKNRQKKTVRMQDGVKEAYIAEPQDLANVLACREVLLATTHQLDRKRKAICVAIEQAGGTQKAAEIHKIQDYLRKTNESFVKRSQIEAMLGDLQDNYLVEKLERAGEGGRHKYQFLGWNALGKFEINDEFKGLFDGTHDPFSGDEFIDTAREINADLTPKASDFMSEGDVEISSDSGQGQQTLTGSPDDTVEVDLARHEEAVRAALQENLDGETVENLDEREPTIKQLVGVVPLDAENDDEYPVEGTLFDPDHEVWASGPDEWVETPNDAEKEIDKAMRRLVKEGVMKTSTTKSRGGQPLAMRVTVKDV